MKLNIEFQNYKLLKDTKACLDGSNVYLVQGANEQGKTSFINGLLTMLQAENKTKQPVTIGEDKGKIALDLQTKGGKDFKMLFEFTDKKNKFTLISNNQLMSKVTDIRSFLQYQSLTADEFISWGNTAEGRRKQRDIVLGLLGDDVKKEFMELTNKENILYEKRAQVNSELKGLESIISHQNKVTLTEEEHEEINKIANYHSCLIGLEEKRVAFLDYNRRIQNTNLGWGKIIDICENLRGLGEKNIADLETIKDMADRNARDEKNVDSIIDEGNALCEKIRALEIKASEQELYAENKKLLTGAKEQSEKLTDQITEVRRAKTKLIADSDFPIQDIEITDDGLMLKSGADLLPFDINQVSTSRIMFIVAKIILLLNKHLPIIVMGRGEAFDQQKLADLSKFAEENDCLLIIDKVTDTAGIEIVGYENKE